MKNTLKAVLFTALPLLLLSATAQCAKAANGSGEVMLEALKKKYATVSTISADFTEVSRHGATGTTTTASGRLYLKKPAMTKWVYDAPENDVLTSDGTTLWYYQKELSQVIKTPAGQGVPLVVTRLLTTISRLDEEFEVSVSARGEDNPWELWLKPNKEMANVKSIRLEVDRDDLLVVKTVIEDVFGVSTEIRLTNIAVDGDIDDGFFEFKVPKGVKVITP